jgi:hypothetical protein
VNHPRFLPESKKRTGFRTLRYAGTELICRVSVSFSTDFRGRSYTSQRTLAATIYR